MTFQTWLKSAAGLALLAAVLVLGWLTRIAQVTRDDLRADQALLPLRFPAATMAFTWLADAAEAAGLALLGVAVIVLVARRRRWDAARLLLTGGAAWILALAVKHVISRPRPPASLWLIRPDATGSFPSGRDARGVAIVGTRKATPQGRKRAEELAAGLARRGITVVSGLAAGIDTAAHLGALDAGGRTVGVIGTGLRRSYPQENAKLQDRIAAEGMVISQFLPDAPPTKTSFPMRNAVMSGYAAATVVVEANWKSGARMQARLALEHGRHVFLLESLLELDWAQDYARRPGATVVRNVDDLVQQLEAITAPRDELVWA